MVPMENPIEAAQVFCPGGTVYMITFPGDSFFRLAKLFNISVQAIVAANPDLDPTNLRLGQRICIPVDITPGPCPGGFLYTIRAGETFFSIARRFGIEVPALAAANPGVDPSQLRVGQQICVPAPGPQPFPCPGGFLYTISPGDTFFILARRYGVTVDALNAANPGVDLGRLLVGQQICIPVSAPAPGL